MGQSRMVAAKQAIVPWQYHSCGVPAGNPEYLHLGSARRRRIFSLVSPSVSLRLDLKAINNLHWAVRAILLFGVCLAVSGCSNYLISVSPPPLSTTELVAGPSPLTAGIVIPDELRNYQVIQRPWANVAYTFQLGQSLGKTIENSAHYAFTRVVLLKAENLWEMARQEKLNRVIMVSLENAAIDAKRVGMFSQQGAIDLRVTLRMQVYDLSQKLIEERLIVGEGASSQPANRAWGRSTWGNSGPDLFTPGVEIALQDIGRKCFRYFSGLKG